MHLNNFLTIIFYFLIVLSYQQLQKDAFENQIEKIECLIGENKLFIKTENETNNSLINYTEGKQYKVDKLQINENAICTYSGLRSDARALIETARVEAANHWFNFNEEMPVEAISLAVCDVALSFSEKKKKQKQKNEKRVVSRPYGVAMLIAGIDADGIPKLFKNDPSGNYVRYKACCIGQGGENGMTTLQSNYKEDMSFDEAILLAGKVLKENLEQKINKDNFEIWYIKKGEGKIVSLTPEEREKLIPKL